MPLRGRDWLSRNSRTSVSTRTRWEHIATRVRELQDTHRVWVVISAMAGHTNRLEQLLADAMAGKPATVHELLADAETLAADVSERGATRMDDKTSDASMEKRKKDGYF